MAQETCQFWVKGSNRLATALLLALPPVALTDVHTERAAAFCSWLAVKTDYASDNTREFCQTYRSKPSLTLFDDIDAFFTNWKRLDQAPTRKKEFDAYWQTWAEKAEATARAANAAAAKKREAERKAQFAANVQSASTDQLCAENRRENGTPDAYAELVRRKAFPVDVLPVIAANRMEIGMSESALLCSWGPPRRVNRTVNAAGEHKQYIYGNVYVYVDGGKITSFQD